MEKVDSLVERARDLTLQQLREHHVGKFHETVDSHIQKIYKAICASEPSKNEFLKSVANETGPNGLPVAASLASVDAFQAYMKDAASCAQAPLKELDVSAPISDYFVSSSHNTYLTGNQLYSDAAASAYTSVSRTRALTPPISELEASPSFQITYALDTKGSHPVYRSFFVDVALLRLMSGTESQRTKTQVTVRQAAVAAATLMLRMTSPQVPTKKRPSLEAKPYSRNQRDSLARFQQD
jgi:hypothetical protein